MSSCFRTFRRSGGYARAAICYVCGQYYDATDALLYCLSCDDDVQEYWYLLGFALRHLGKRPLAVQRSFLKPARLEGDCA